MSPAVLQGPINGAPTTNGVSSQPMEVIFLGTGTSSSLPHLECLTAPPEGPPCNTCLSTLTPQGKKNFRRNTSAVVRTKAKDGRDVTIVIDAGKNFQAASLEWFPKYKLRRIDALLITHPHADAMNGLDDLRGWTLNGAIQSHIDVYVSHTTFVEVQRSFPYLVSKEFASGGGDVPEFKWHIINDKVPFEILDTGIMVTPFAVHHGRIFSVLPPPAYTPTPTTTSPSTPTKTGIPLPPPKPEECPDGKTGGLGKSDSNSEIIHPYLCYGFKIENQLIYISDVSHIPEDVWPILTEPRRAAMVVLDCLRLRPHTSHFGLQASIEAARRIGGVRTYLTGFDHAVSHEEYVTIGEIAGGDKRDVGKLTESERAGAELVGNGQEQELWVRPAYDGLRVFIGGNSKDIRDECY